MNNKKNEKTDVNSKLILSSNARLVETILFLENDSVSKEKLLKMTNLDSDSLFAALEEIKEHFDTHMHGITLSNKHDRFQFLPSRDLHKELRKCYGKKVDKRLSKAALETLSIVAYSQPVTRREIDNIRGVSSDTIVRLLRDREYIKVIGRKDVPGHPCLYGTSRKFLLEFNLRSISELPKLSDIDRSRFMDEQMDEE
ncbi:MAG: SMC-Scp complex subunit ScpB [Sphaerochaetaceae bacterium]|nr:SMC-Scp complex subunit ScpB [Sphaerochaetaceae bacterium]MDC7243884.1 SMC-Scp complex subunit ScpB [Sphaerochaetaceae bacterium]MDC7248722.1 SMC-Scp complex subunit ScpB [Sphaerochaetaceae bacterium]